ncbi:uncharacterized protein B0H64DRAFT_439367 [Chaetomium fimeti]|uniref:Protein kinase domain-containing protein n=1 Tax=Chaetomium fimeti TaxID=1854472 RepID=A0AAE0HMH7_9PEZI|nr:hypothetical protein B0H64DRAFT_439367 [Chaetomium fimeti]
MPSSTPMPPIPDMRPRFPPQLGPPPELWSPPPDPEKPACPYRPGFSVEIKRHIPPPPFGDPHHGPGAWRERSDVDLHEVTQTRVVMEYPPLEPPPTSPSPPAPTVLAAKLTILSALAVEDGRGPQLVVCSVTPHASPSPGQSEPPAPYQAVAKIFDPLYYSFENRVAAHMPVLVAWKADVHYTHEAAALDHLAKRAQTDGDAGLLAPKYFGSWTFTLPITHAGRKRQRAIRLVLMENIKGPSMRAVCLAPSALASYTEQDRLAIFAAVLDGVARQEHAGVDQRDLAARNVVLRTGSPSPAARNPEQPLPQPVIVDYNTAVVFELSRHGKHPSQLHALPPNPMELFWRTSLPDFPSWTPAAWDGNPKAHQEWLKARFGGEGRVTELDAGFEALKKEHLKVLDAAGDSLSERQRKKFSQELDDLKSRSSRRWWQLY